MTVTIDSFEADGFGCPMAHCNRTDDSLHDLPPLRSVEIALPITDPIVSPRATIHLGAFTGETMAVCTYDSPLHPAVVAYDYQTGAVKWTSPLEDLPGLFQRWPSGILMAKIAIDGGPKQHFVFVANPIEFVAYTANGDRLWKRRATDIAAAGIGLPTSLSYTDAKELVCATTQGWVIKLDPIDGRVIDAQQLNAQVCVDGIVYRGAFTTTKSPAVIGNVMYLIADFEAKVTIPPLNPSVSPVHVLRIELSRSASDRRIKPIGYNAESPDRILIGFYKGTGSPPAYVTTDGRVILFAHAHALNDGRLLPSITAIEDHAGCFTQRWRCVLEAEFGDDVYAAPALHADSRTLLVTTLNDVYVFRNVDQLAGQVPAPRPLPACQLISLANDPRVAEMKVGSPFGLAYDRDAHEIVAYTNFRLKPRHGFINYGFLGAFALPATGAPMARPVWHQPLAVSAKGTILPGLGTFGQPALFRYDRGGAPATGLIVNTVFTGTYIFK